MQAADRSLRSVFVGNIPYDATEEKLRDIFSAVGPVLSFRIVFDRETGKPKGYGFCEYKDQETATSAIRNLNGHDLGGRPLRVDSASNERARDEPENPNTGDMNSNPQHQTIHQSNIAPEPMVDAHTLINNVMMSLSPEQLFDICKQLKSSLLVNPNETRQLLLQHPQLSYAILQSLVMVKAIDAQTAMNTLHKQLIQPAPLQPAMPMIAPMGPPMQGPNIPVPQQGPPPGASTLVIHPQPLAPAAPMAMQPQLLNPYAFIGSNPIVATSSATQPPAPLQPVNLPVVSSAPVVAPADPRLARQQQQQQQQQSQQQPQTQQTGMSQQERQSFLMQVVNMTDQEISLLPPDQQDKIYLLRRQYLPGAIS